MEGGTIAKLVITGGPCAGKSSVASMLKEEFADQIITVPEAATLLLSGGFPMPGQHLDWCERWQRSFQRSVLQLQKSLEETYALMAERTGASLLICDNGLPSGAAYMPGGINEFIDYFCLDWIKELADYDAVIHLETIAISQPQKYGRHNNSSRYTTLEDAIIHDQIIKEVWENHPRRIIIPSNWSLEDKIKKVIEVTKRYL